MRILIIEDDAEVSAYLVKGFRENGHVVDAATNGRDGLFMATTETYDLLIIDRMMPELDGLTLIKTLRGAGNHTPALILSALGEVDDRVKGLRAGGDDYLVKPFAFAELLARAEILARRNTPAASAESDAVLTSGEVTIDLLSRKVSRAGKSVELQPREFQLLAYLMKHQGQVVTRTMLLENVWDYHFDPQTNVIDVHISRLRRKLEQGSEVPFIRTVRGAGYIVD